MRHYLMIMLLICLWIMPVSAQDDVDCPSETRLSLPRANAACAGVERNQVCYGSGTVEYALHIGENIQTPVAGDRFDAENIARVTHSVADSNAIDVTVMQIQANMVETQPGRNASLLLFGDVMLENLVDPLPEITFTSTGAVNIRDLPELEADIIYRMALRETLTLNGRTDDNGWLRVELPDNQQVGWVAVDQATNLSGNIADLTVVEATTRLYRPFQVMRLETGIDDAPCNGAPESGVLIQTPGDSAPVELVVNDVNMRLNATVFIQVDELMTINVLDGEAAVESFDTLVNVPAGARTHIPMTNELAVNGSPDAPEPYVNDDLQSLPVNNLLYRFALPEPLTQAEIDAYLAELAEQEREVVVIQADDDDSVCRRTIARDADLAAGPGSFYEITRRIRAGVSVTPVYQAIDPDGASWWQLIDGNWIRANAVETSGPCNEVPLVTTFEAPRFNTLSIEECQTTNGPLRQGQRVEIEFVDGGWETYQEALQAPRIDPGTITVSNETLWYIYPSRPFLINERYYRYFRATWEAVPGSFRIVGERLTYNVSCNVTVPVGP